MAKAETLVDTFNDNVIDQYHALDNPDGRWDVTASDRISEVNGRVEIRPPGNQPSSSYLEYVSHATYDLADSEVRVELVRTLIRSSRTGTFLRVQPDATSYVLTIGVGSSGMLYASALLPGSSSTTSFSQRPYDPDRHRWLRLREQVGTVYWEVSADGDEWVVLASIPTPFDVSQVKVRFGAGTSQPVTAPGTAIFDNLNVRGTSLSRPVEERRLSAREVRDRVSELAAHRRHDEHVNNNDEVHPTRPLAGNYSKGLKHDAVGDPDPASYASLLRALQSEVPEDFEEITLGTLTSAQLSEYGRLKLTNPQAGLAFDIAGPDAQERTLPPAPRFDSDVAAHEAGELYWMAVARDVHFADYATQAATANTIIKRAIDSLNSEFPEFGGTAPVTAQNLFRGVWEGDQVGPYVSQFLLKGNVDSRKPDGLGQDAVEGFISYGARVIDQRLIPATAGVDYLLEFGAWLNVQNGLDRRELNTFDKSNRRFIRNLRDGATLVHFDQVLDVFYNAAWILMSEPTGNQKVLQPGTTGRPQIDLEFPKDGGNPYDPPGTEADSRTQVGFATFGPIHLLQTLAEVLGRALRAVWWQKWGVHRRLRPEEYGGRVDNWIVGRRDYPLDPSIKNSLMTGGLSPYFGHAGEKFPGSYLLPQAYAEGAPTHPAYGAGHATGAGACVTILKAFFDDTKAIENPVQASADGLSLVDYTGADAGDMYVRGELNKLAGNIALFRNAAGVHWRSDYTESVLFGEAIAIAMLREMSLGFNERDAYFSLTKFDTQKIRIYDGKVEVVPN
jgi:hypothetical protein